MSTRRAIAAVLLRLYPAAWRREYGGELADILTSRPLTATIAIDVLGSALRQRVRTATPSAILGVISMLVVLSQFFVDQNGLGRYWPAAVRPSGMTFPTVRVTLLASELYVYVGIACGFWTASRFPGPASRGGLAAMRMIQIGGWPVVVAGVLIELGVFDASLAAVAGRGFTPTPLEMVLAPIAQMPLFWIWGWMGARLQQWSSRRRETSQPKIT